MTKFLIFCSHNLFFAVVLPLLSLAMIIGVIFNALKLLKNTINIVLIFNVNGFALRKLNEDKLS